MNTSPAATQIASMAGTGGSSDVFSGPAPDSPFSAAMAGAASGLAENLDSEDEWPPDDMPSAAALAFMATLASHDPLTAGASAAGGMMSGAVRAAGGQAAGTDLPWAQALLRGLAGAPASNGAGTVPGAHLLPAEEMQDSLVDVMKLLTQRGGSESAEAATASLTADADTAPLYGPQREAGTTGAANLLPQPVLRQPVGTPRWADELGRHMMLMSVRGQHEGSLRLSPEHLGPLEVRISVGQDSTNVWFGAQNADTRAALSEALPRLRELFAESGLSLGEAGVSQDMPGRESAAADPLPTVAGSPAIKGGMQQAPPSVQLRSALLDAWA